MNTYYIVSRGELYHHGILGMHWGIRRYQNKDGTLTAEGIKRYRTDLKFRAKYEKKQAKRQKEETDAIKKKPLKDLTDDELRERINRLELEKRIVELERSITSAVQSTPKPQDNTSKVITAGKKFALSVASNASNQVAKNLGSYIANAATKALMKKLNSDKEGKG